jgi:DNA-binding NarL/FixJ family response regulator
MATAIAQRIPVSILTDDEISRAGIATQLRHRCEVRVVDGSQLDGSIVIVAANEIDESALRLIRNAHAAAAAGVVLVARLLEEGLLPAVQAGVTTLLPRSAVTGDRLVDAIRAAADAGNGVAAADLTTHLIGQLRRVVRDHPAVSHAGLGGFTEREIKVLRLVAEGYDTAEVGKQLFCSERTVKYILQAATSRLDLRNRTHAVAYALRLGLI